MSESAFVLWERRIADSNPVNYDQAPDSTMHEKQPPQARAKLPRRVHWDNGTRAKCSEAWPLASVSRISPRVARRARGVCRVASRAIAQRRAGTSAMSTSGVAPGPSSPRSASASSATAPACTRPALRWCRQTRRPWAASLGPHRTPCRVGRRHDPEAPAEAAAAPAVVRLAAAAAQAVARAGMAASVGAGRCRRAEPPDGAPKRPVVVAGSLSWCWATARG